APVRNRRGSERPRLVRAVQHERRCVGGSEHARREALPHEAPGRPSASETGEPKRVVGFDPRTESFLAVVPVSGTIRNFMFHRETGMLWFGTDTNYTGRIPTRNATS